LKKSMSSASGSNTTSGTSVASRFLSSLSHRGSTTHSDQSSSTRRWSYNSDDFPTVIHGNRDIANSGTVIPFASPPTNSCAQVPCGVALTDLVPSLDRYDLNTISSRSTATTESGVLSDIPSFISEYTFKTSSGAGSKSRPSLISSDASQYSVQSDWIRNRRAHSTESLPETISEYTDGAGQMEAEGDPSGAHSAHSGKTARSFIKQKKEAAAFYDAGHDAKYHAKHDAELPAEADGQPTTPTSASPRRFRMFKKPTPSIESQLSPPPSYPPRPQFHRSHENLDIGNVSPSTAVPHIPRRTSNPVNQPVLLRVGGHGDTFVQLVDMQNPHHARHPPTRSSRSSHTSSGRE